MMLFLIDKQTDKETDKLAKIRPMIEAIRNQCVKEESPKNTILWTNKSFSAKQNEVKCTMQGSLKKWGFKNLVRAGASRFMYNFYIYGRKEENIDLDWYSRSIFSSSPP